MAKNQSRTPGRDVRGGKGKGARPVRPSAGKGARGEKNRPPRPLPGAARRGPQERTDLIEGRRAVEEALSCGMPLRSALVQERSGERDQALERIAARLEEAGVPVERVPRARLDSLSSHGAHQGVVVRTRPFQYAELSDVIAAAGEGEEELGVRIERECVCVSTGSLHSNSIGVAIIEGAVYDVLIGGSMVVLYS